jgi:hypothetical protein
MRNWFVLALLTTAAAACGKDVNPGGHGSGSPDAPGMAGSNLAFEVTSGDITLSPGQEVTYCWYFHTSNTTTSLVNKWVSNMLPGSHHLILFLGGPAHADGLDTTNSCGLGGASSASNPPIWVYASQQLQQTEDLPADDGTGKPLAQPIPANSEAAIQMHYINETDNTVTAHVQVQAYALPANTTFTQTDAYITYNNMIAIPPGAVAPAAGTVWTGTCPVPPNVKFWTISTHSHKQSMTTQVMDGSTMIFQSDNWSDPGSMMWDSTPFYTFQNSLSWTCSYDNNAPPPYEPTGQSNANVTVVAGQSAATNEMCMAVGYYFPSTGPTFGLWDASQCLQETIAGED